MRSRSAFLALAALALAGCTTTKTPVTPPAPAVAPQVQVLQYAQLATAAGDTAAHVLVALCVPATGQAATLDLVSCNQVKSALLTAKSFVDFATSEANKVPAQEPWSTARINIAIAGASLVISKVNNPALQSALDALAAPVSQIRGVQ